MVGHQTFEDQLACLSDQNMFASPIKTLHLVARRYYMVPTQGGVSFPLECGLFTVCYYFQVLCLIKTQQC